MQRSTRKAIRRIAIAVPVLAALLYLVPWITVIWLVTGLIDVMRNKPKSSMLFSRYFMGNGIPTWLLSPVNLLADVLSYRNPGIYTLDDLPGDYRREVEDVLNAFRERRDEIIAKVDTAFGEGRRGMYVWRWYGKQHINDVAEFDRDFKYVKTIAVSVFSGKESTTWHFGPLRLSIRVLLNLDPADSDEVYIECQGTKHLWRDNPLYIFDDTLFHQSVNRVDARRYNVFMDVVRPSPVPGMISAMLVGVSAIADQIKSVFYKNWTMLGGGKKASEGQAG
ncbi:MAG: aspartyl/asparaginyl beta-hydroxylase domain-containing protein [Oricola sp.]